MGRSKWPPATDLAAGELARDRGDHRHFERFAGLERREDSWKTCSKQRLSRSRRSAHQQIVPARSGNLERALGNLLPFDLRQVGTAVRRLRFGEHGDGAQVGPLEVREQRQQVGRRNHVELSCPARFTALHRGADQTLVLRRRMNRREQHARRSGDPPVEAELADGDIMRKSLGVGRPDRGKEA